MPAREHLRDPRRPPNIYGLAFDSAGYLYASDITQTALFKIAPGAPGDPGGSITNFGTLSSGAQGLAFDHSGQPLCCAIL